MTCAGAQLLIEEGLDRSLSPGEMEALRAHLTRCRECERRRRKLQQLAASMGRLESPPVADATWRAMVARAATEVQSERRGVPLRAVAIVAAAAALVLACWIGWLRTRAPGSPPPRSASLIGPTRAAGQPPRPPLASDGRPKVLPHRNAPPRRPPTARPPAPARLASGRPGPERSPVAPSPGPQSAPPAAELAPDDVYLIYETALTFARDDGGPSIPTGLVTVARAQAEAGDLAGAIASYEAAVEASVRSPVLHPLAAEPQPDPGLVLGLVPDPPTGLLVAWLPGGE